MRLKREYHRNAHTEKYLLPQLRAFNRAAACCQYFLDGRDAHRTYKKSNTKIRGASSCSSLVHRRQVVDTHGKEVSSRIIPDDTLYRSCAKQKPSMRLHILGTKGTYFPAIPPTLVQTFKKQRKRKRASWNSNELPTPSKAVRRFSNHLVRESAAKACVRWKE